MNRIEIEIMARDCEADQVQPGLWAMKIDELELFAKHAANLERQACIDLLMGLHEAQKGNGNHNYYHYAANLLKQFRN